MKFMYYFMILTIMVGLSACQGAVSTTVDPSTIPEETAAAPILVQKLLPPKINDVKDVTSLIPKGWQPLVRQGGPDKAVGDLNKDGIPDVAVVIEKLEAKQGEAPERALFIAFGNGDGSYTLSIIADHAILKADEGGIWGDPLAGISIDRGSVVVSFYGGSNDRWYGKYRFRYQNDDWYLIGATVGSFFSGTMTETTGNEEDYNLLTGDYVKRIVDDPQAEKPTTHTITGNIGKKKLLKLRDFVATGSTDQFLK